MTKKAVAPANPDPERQPNSQSVVTTPSQHPTPRPIATTQTGERQFTSIIDRSLGLKVSGSSSEDFAMVLIRETMEAIRTVSGEADIDRVSGTLNAAMAALAAFKPADEIEGMIAAQAVALHHGAMECLRRAMLGDQHADTASKLRRDGANLARGMTDMLEALDRKRGKGPQVVRVERVVVHEGGQAIVGNVQPAAGGRG